MTTKLEQPTTLGESVVEEVRAIRELIDHEVGHDLERLAEQARAKSAEIRRQNGMKVAEPPCTPVRHPARAK